MTNATHTLLLPNQVDEALAAHFAALGVGTIAAYKLWCHRHGLSTALDKTPQERAEERVLFASLQPSVDPAASKEHDPRRAAPTRYSISGQVVDQTAYLSEVAIYLSGSVQDTVWTDAEGRFAFADLPEGRYRLIPFKDEHLFFPPEQAVVLSGEDAVGVEFVEVFAVLAVAVERLEVDGTPQTTVVELTNSGLGRLIWQVRHSAAWLSVSGAEFDGVVEERADGSLAGQGAGMLTVETSGAGLAAGAYADTLYVQSNGGEVAIPVNVDRRVQVCTRSCMDARWKPDPVFSRCRLRV